MSFEKLLRLLSHNARKTENRLRAINGRRRELSALTDDRLKSAARNLPRNADVIETLAMMSCGISRSSTSTRPAGRSNSLPPACIRKFKRLDGDAASRPVLVYRAVSLDRRQQNAKVLVLRKRFGISTALPVRFVAKRTDLPTEIEGEGRAGGRCQRARRHEMSPTQACDVLLFWPL